MTATWSWADVPGLDDDVRTVVSKPVGRRRRVRLPQAAPAGLLPPAPPPPPVAAAPAAGHGGWCVWSCDRGAYLAQDGTSYRGLPGEWPMVEAKAIAATRPVGERVGAIPVPGRG